MASKLSKTAAKNAEREARRIAICYWGLDEDEERAFRRYLRGKRTCAEYDFLPARIQAAVKELDRIRFRPDAPEYNFCRVW